MYAALDFAFAISNLGPHRGAWVLRVKRREFAQDFLGALVARFGCGDGDFDNLVAALVGALVEHALLAQTEALGVGGALRDVLMLSMKGSPIMEGTIKLNTTIGIPPLAGKVKEKLLLDGTFEVTNGKFLRSRIQEK